MAEKSIPTRHLILFSITTITIFFLGIEISARLALSIKKNDFKHLLYGLKNNIPRQTSQHFEGAVFQQFEGAAGEVAYHKATPSADTKNPVNRRGFRGAEIYSKKSGTIRIICLGGSTTHGDSVVFADTYPAILQHKLDEKFGAGRFEVINAGQPALTLAQIITLTKHDVLSLRPDIVVLMSISNNLYAPGFWFVEVKGRKTKNNQLKQLWEQLLVGTKDFLVQNLVCADMLQKWISSGVAAQYYRAFDWKSFSAALLAPDNIWQKEFIANYTRLLDMLCNSNPHITIIVIDEAFNISRVPVMEAPFNRAREIMSDINSTRSNVHTLEVQGSLLNAAKHGKDVWASPTGDPLHLSRQGNEIIADLLVQNLSASYDRR